jgi:hypothetical protein
MCSWIHVYRQQPSVDDPTRLYFGSPFRSCALQVAQIAAKFKLTVVN